MVKAMVATAMVTPMQTNHNGPIRTPTKKMETAISKAIGIVMRTKMDPAQLKGCLLSNPLPFVVCGGCCCWCCCCNVIGSDDIVIADVGVIIVFKFSVMFSYLQRKKNG